jgi:DNA segregation ATPase FtsK/SpoIIIE-like protein
LLFGCFILAAGQWLVPEETTLAVRLMVWAVSVSVAGSLLVYFVSGVWVRLESVLKARAERLQAVQQTALMEAQVAQARREAEVKVITTKDGLVLISDLNPTAGWMNPTWNPRAFLYAAEGIVDPQTGRPLMEPSDAASEEERENFTRWLLSRHAPAKPSRVNINTANGNPQLPAGSLPEKVLLRDILPSEPSIQNLTFGIGMTPDGQRRVVRGDMRKLVHVAVGGSSGFGKSKFLQMVGMQLHMSMLPVELFMVDMGRSSLVPFQDSGLLVQPVAYTSTEAMHVFQYVMEEYRRRQQIHADLKIESAEEYAALTARGMVKPMPPLIGLLDEANDVVEVLSEHDDRATMIRQMRKYDMWLLMAAQEWSSHSIDVRVRRQLSTKVQFKVNDMTQARVLVGRDGARRIEENLPPGRGIVIMPGKPMLQVQTAYITRADMEAALRGDFVKMSRDDDAMVIDSGLVVSEPPPTEDDLMQQFVQLVQSGTSRSEASQMLFSRPYEGTSWVNRLKQALGER